MGRDTTPAQVSQLKENLSDPFWRWRNLYWILDEDGNRVKFTIRPAIEQFIRDMHRRNVILKARQLGFSTFLLIYILDTLLFTSGLAAAVVAHRLDAAKRLFRSKIRYPYNNLPESLRRANPVLSGKVTSTECTASQELELANGSSLIADVSVRSGTYQLVHLSEYGILCSDAPQRATEVQTGTLETAHVNSLIFIESTAKGAVGHFYELCKQGWTRAKNPRPLAPLEFRSHFFGWYWSPEYVADPEGVRFSEVDYQYFASIENQMGVTLTDEQRTWYVLKKRTLKLQMRSEHPSTPQEAFEAQIQGAFYGDLMALLADRGQICEVPHNPAYKVHTTWDLGGTTACWFWQLRGPSPHVIRYHEAQGLGATGWAELLDRLADEEHYRYGQHFAPFDVTTQNGVKVIAGIGILKAYKEAGINFDVLPMERNEIGEGIPRTRDLLPLCYFDEKHCERGIWCLRTVHEAINSALSTDDHPVFTGKVADGPENHGADGFRYVSMAVPRVQGRQETTASRKENEQLDRMYARPA